MPDETTTESEAAQQTLAEFIDEHGVTMTIEPVTTRGDLAMSERPMFHYSYKITARGQTMAGYYSVGIGNAKKPTGHYDADVRKDTRGIWQVYSYGRNGWVNTIIPPDPPSLADILGAVAGDASDFDSTPVFIDFAREMGFDRMDQYEEARRCYDGCAKALADLRRLFGGAGAETLMYSVERL